MPRKVVGNELTQQQLDARHFCGEQRLHGAALPLAGDHQRGQDRANHRHDNRHRARNDKVLADGGRVKPVACLHVDERFKRLPPVFGALHLP